MKQSDFGTARSCSKNAEWDVDVSVKSKAEAISAGRFLLHIPNVTKIITAAGTTNHRTRLRRVGAGLIGFSIKQSDFNPPRS